MRSEHPIAIVVPNEHSRITTERVFEQQIRRREIIVSVVGPSDIRSGYQRLCDAGVSAIMARGGTYEEFFCLGGDIPLLRMEITMLDILDLLKVAEESGLYQKVYLFLHEKINFEPSMCTRFLKIPVEYHRHSSVADVSRTLASIVPESGSLMIGSGFVSTLWKNSAVPFWDILLKPETMMTYYQQAVSMVDQMDRESENLSQLQTILSQIGEGIVVVDEEGTICNMNRRGQQLLNLQDYTPIGLKISDVMERFPFTKMLGTECAAPKRQLLVINDTTLSISIVSYWAHQKEIRYLLTLQPVGEIQKLEHDIRYKLAQKGLTAYHTFEDILTCDSKMKRVIEQAKEVANAEGSVLIYGESGTGKELFAQSIHKHSVYCQGPFVAVNCAALSESLLESELFGYVGGAFTGARKEGKAGLFELAHKGTLFLDEINSMSVNLQAKLLRVLEERRVMRLGSDYVIPLDIRIIAASNQDLTESIRSGQFRTDLYYRLSTFILKIPCLDERKGDIELLFRTFVARQMNVPLAQVKLDPEFRARLKSHRWLGNVRELRNAALRYVVYKGQKNESEIFVEEQQKERGTLVSPEGKIDLNTLSRTVEELVIRSLLSQGCTRTEVARLLGISRQALYQKCKRMDLGRET